MNSFFSYARQLQTLREGIKTDEQKEIFDMEVIIKVNFIQEYWKKLIFKINAIQNFGCYKTLLYYFQTASWIPPTLPRVSYSNIDRTLILIRCR